MVSEDNTVVFAQTPLLKTQLEALKRLAGTTITCPAIHRNEEKKEVDG